MTSKGRRKPNDTKDKTQNVSGGFPFRKFVCVHLSLPNNLTDFFSFFPQCHLVNLSAGQIAERLLGDRGGAKR